MLIYVCSCCYHPEVLADKEQAENLQSIKFAASYREDEDANPGYFIVQVGDNPPIFYNEHRVRKLPHDFLLKMGYRWEETAPASINPRTGEIVNPLGWWREPKNRRARLEIVPEK